MAKKAKKTGAEADAEDRRAEKTAAKIVTRAGKAGLILSVSRTDKRLRAPLSKIAKRTGGMTSVYVTGVVEAILEKALGFAGKEATAAGSEEGGDKKAKRITPQHIAASLKHDPDLARHFIGFVFPTHGEVPKAVNFILCKEDADERKKKMEESAQRAAEKKAKEARVVAAAGDATD